jgi:hypothetical protein
LSVEKSAISTPFLTSFEINSRTWDTDSTEVSFFETSLEKWKWGLVHDQGIFAIIEW